MRFSYICSRCKRPCTKPPCGHVTKHGKSEEIAGIGHWRCPVHGVVPVTPQLREAKEAA